MAFSYYINSPLQSLGSTRTGLFVVSKKRKLIAPVPYEISNSTKRVKEKLHFHGNLYPVLKMRGSLNWTTLWFESSNIRQLISNQSMKTFEPLVR